MRDLALGAHRLGAGQLGQALHPRLRLLGLAALALKRSMKACRCARSACSFSKAICCWRRCSARWRSKLV
jgi:hypothetical protein